MGVYAGGTGAFVEHDEEHWAGHVSCGSMLSPSRCCRYPCLSRLGIRLRPSLKSGRGVESVAMSWLFDEGDPVGLVPSLWDRSDSPSPCVFGPFDYLSVETTCRRGWSNFKKGSIRAAGIGGS